MRFCESMVSSVLQASPFHITHDGESWAIFFVTASNASQSAWVSLITQKCDLASFPAVVKE